MDSSIIMDNDTRIDDSNKIQKEKIIICLQVTSPPPRIKPELLRELSSAQNPSQALPPKKETLLEKKNSIYE